MKEVKIKLFEYDELNEDAKEKAFNEYEEFLRDYPNEYEDENGIMQLDNMDTWTNEEIKEYVEDSIRINKYYFFEDGEMSDCVTYTGKHPKAGITEFKFKNRAYEVQE